MFNNSNTTSADFNAINGEKDNSSISPTESGKHYCINCNKLLERDEIGAHKKLINRGAKEFMCKTCLAQFYKCDVALIDEKIKQFKQQGCLLFK